MTTEQRKLAIETLHNLNASSHLTGFSIMLLAVDLMIDNPKYVLQTMNLYDKLNELTESNSERSIRYIISKMYEADKEALNQFCQNFSKKAPSPNKVLASLYYHISEQ